MFKQRLTTAGDRKNAARESIIANKSGCTEILKRLPAGTQKGLQRTMDILKDIKSKQWKELCIF